MDAADAGQIASELAKTAAGMNTRTSRRTLTSVRYCTGSNREPTEDPSPKYICAAWSYSYSLCLSNHRRCLLPDTPFVRTLSTISNSNGCSRRVAKLRISVTGSAVVKTGVIGALVLSCE